MKTLYRNAKVYTGTLPLQECFAVEDGKILYAGSEDGARSLSFDETVDLNGAFVCAGFHDSHMHILNYGNALRNAQLNKHTTSLREMLDALRDFAREHPPKKGQWLIGRGWNHDYFTDVHRMPTRDDLDTVSTEYPILASRCCGHCLVANTAAIELCGITPETPCPEGGRIGMENGRLDGRFYDDAMDLFYGKRPVPTKEDVKEALRLGCQALNRYGVIASQTDDYTSCPGVGWETVDQAYRELEAEGALTVRVYEQCNFHAVDDLKKFHAAGNNTGVGDDHFMHGPLKLLGDGSLGARTALLSRPYADDPTTRGIPVFSQELLNDLICCANDADMQVAVHAIGDGCLDYVLNAFELALSRHPRKDHRHGIVHCQITRPDQQERMVRLGLHIYAQSIFLDYDVHIVEARVGDELAASSYSWKTLLDRGLSVSNGSDCPVELPDVMAGIQCAVTRRSLNGDKEYLPHEAFSVQEALDSFTIRSAEARFAEDRMGKIAPGYLADFTVLGENPFEVDPAHLKDVPVLAAYLGGKRV